MSEEKTQQEPSMEEILASIRRIISEDGEAEGEGAAAEEHNGSEQPAAEAAAEDSGDVLELTQMVAEDGSTVDLTEEGAEAAEPEPSPEPEPEPEPEPAAADEEAAPSAEPQGRLVSDQAADASIDAFAELARAIEPEPASTTDLRFSDSGRTVEELVMQLIRPMLREWLDENLPPLVERLVQKEIRHLVRRSEPD